MTLKKLEMQKIMYAYSFSYQTSDDIIDFNSEQNVTLERQTLYCVPVPGENKWLKNVSFLEDKKFKIFCLFSLKFSLLLFRVIFAEYLKLAFIII